MMAAARSGALFGTDGVRGVPGKEPLTRATVRALGYQAARFLLARARREGPGVPLIALGRDTRGSGPELSRWLVEGFSAAGAETADLGVIPTPGVAYLAPRLGAFAGAVISASHNPAEFNGIKFFDAAGFKMAPALERQVEGRLAESLDVPSARARAPRRAEAAAAGYLDFLRSAFPAALDLSGVRLVLDCANGAASALAPRLFAGLGAEVFTLGDSPDGRNINAGCGALEPAALVRELRRRRAHAGVAFDGDADRAVLCDETGALLDGDVVVAAAADRLDRRGALRGGKVALTVMSNYGLLRFLEDRGIGVVIVPVGDRHVTEAIERDGLSLGGESSGHVVFRDFAPTGDGMLTALQTLAAWRESGRPLSALRGLYRPTPQTLRNLRVSAKPALEALPRAADAVERARKALEGRGRVFVRYSGTEPALRVLVEGPEERENARLADAIVAAYRAETGQENE